MSDARRGRLAAEPNRRTSVSADDTHALGARLGPALRAGDVIVLSGPLGSGKTCFVGGLAEGMGCRGRVRSPSFTLVNEYDGATPLFHLDLYRVEGADAEGLGLEERLERGALVAEWGEKLPVSLRADALTLTFEIVSADQRAIEATAAGTRGGELLAAWRAVAESR